ncbi:hypothetical protein [Isoptericola sp. NPDC056134]|uniref:hypothetical protein n=1 Tax=Isoptericola sp. NPDC056134 TaxID=3345723 RepID=UPI0035EB0D36
MDFLPQWASDLSGWGVVAVMVVMLLTGRGLATRREVDAEKARADTWQDAWRTEHARNAEKDAQMTELLEIGRTSAKVLEAIQAARKEGSP